MGRRQCELEGCTKRAESGGTPHCKAHGGGRRCQTVDCTKSARGDTGALHRARRGQAVPDGGLRQGG